MLACFCSHYVDSLQLHVVAVLRQVFEAQPPTREEKQQPTPKSLRGGISRVVSQIFFSGHHVCSTERDLADASSASQRAHMPRSPGTEA